LNVVFVLYIWLFKAQKKEIIIEQVDNDDANKNVDTKQNKSFGSTPTHLFVRSIQATLKTPDPQLTFKSEVHPNRLVLCRGVLNSI